MADKVFVFIVSEETGAAWRQIGFIKLSIETCTANGKICTNVKANNERVSSVWPGLSRFKGKNDTLQWFTGLLTCVLLIWLKQKQKQNWCWISCCFTEKQLDMHQLHSILWGHCSCDCMVVGFITTYAINAYHHWYCEFKSRSGMVYSIQHYAIKFVSDLWQVGGFLQYNLEIVKSGIKHHYPNPNLITFLYHKMFDDAKKWYMYFQTILWGKINLLKHVGLPQDHTINKKIYKSIDI